MRSTWWSRGPEPWNTRNLLHDGCSWCRLLLRLWDWVHTTWEVFSEAFGLIPPGFSLPGQLLCRAILQSVTECLCFGHVLQHCNNLPELRKPVLPGRMFYFFISKIISIILRISSKLIAFCKQSIWISPNNLITIPFYSLSYTFYKICKTWHLPVN